MTEFSKAIIESELSWFRINLTKRRELDAFRNTIIAKVNAINEVLVTNDNCDDDAYVEYNKRSYLFPSSVSDVDGYYESIMNSIKFSCWVKCTEEELKEILNELNENEVSSDASRKSNSGVIRVVDDSEVGTLRWIINYTPQNLYRANVSTYDTKPATLNLPGGTVLSGELGKMRGKVDTDKFFFTLLGEKYFVIINKGVANETVDLTQEIERAKKVKNKEKINNERHWMVLRVSRGSEIKLMQKIESWKEDRKDREEDDIFFETYLPMFVKDVKRNDKIIGQRKALYCPGYLFINTSILDLINLECDKMWDGTPISRFLVRQSMRKSSEVSRALTISDADMTNFMFAADSNLGNVTLDADDYVDDEYVRYFHPGKPFNQCVGKVLHKGDKLYLTFLPIGLMTVTQAIQIDSSEIRKLSNKEKAELKL